MQGEGDSMRGKGNSMQVKVGSLSSRRRQVRACKVRARASEVERACEDDGKLGGEVPAICPAMGLQSGNKSLGFISEENHQNNDSAADEDIITTVQEIVQIVQDVVQDTTEHRGIKRPLSPEEGVKNPNSGHVDGMQKLLEAIYHGDKLYLHLVSQNSAIVASLKAGEVKYGCPLHPDDPEVKMTKTTWISQSGIHLVIDTIHNEVVFAVHISPWDEMTAKQKQYTQETLAILMDWSKVIGWHHAMEKGKTVVP
ncbi:hypothetical protein L210DRAFT_3499209 [Boletus edulis BED1]|uniref:Uncharacterized protein n=1 Tax=Boletus edulis BED1 TaxID=1328754 RepID=A0AAD4C8D6_BOLED|nr:hypothetical protein L210DRAFT_3499209 [Boletus edulis BED1]